MSIFTRILRLWKADMHGVMDQFEDKELLLKQYLREMETNLQQKNNHLQQLIVNGQKIESNMVARQQEIEKLEQDLMLALKKEKDDLAKLLIRKQRTQQKHYDQLEQQRDTTDKETLKLTQLLDEQRLQHETLKVKAASFCRKAEQNRFHEASSIFNTTEGTVVVDEDEIEMELLRRKEQLHAQGESV